MNYVSFVYIWYYHAMTYGRACFSTVCMSHRLWLHTQRHWAVELTSTAPPAAATTFSNEIHYCSTIMARAIASTAPLALHHSIMATLHTHRTNHSIWWWFAYAQAFIISPLHPCTTPYRPRCVRRPCVCARASVKMPKMAISNLNGCKWFFRQT